MAEIRIENLIKNFGDLTAVKDLNLTISDGEFLTLLGPSGCGKTTTLRCIAGLERQSAGDIRIGDAGGQRPARPATAISPWSSSSTRSIRTCPPTTTSPFPCAPRRCRQPR